MAKKMVAFDESAIQDEANIAAEEAELNPMIHLLFDFFLDPRATPIGYAYGLFLTLLVSLHLLIVGLETCDGPNQYPASDSARASYSFLLTQTQYWTATCVVTIPLVIDAMLRAILLTCVFTAESSVLRKKLMRSSFNVTLIALDFISLIPFCIQAGYLRPNNIQLSSSAEVLYEVIDILIVNRIFRVTKDIPAIWAIRIALARSGQHLVIPFFVFIMFNITAAVIFFFAEPCYDVTTCPWHDLFEAMFFSVVSMTSVGYGNQTPRYALCRLVACLVMVFGAVFMSMPLAIIGNEYSNAWQEVTKELQEERAGNSQGEGKTHFMFSRQQESVIAPVATLSSMAAVRGSLLKTQAASRAAMLALSAIGSTKGTPSYNKVANSAGSTKVEKASSDSKSNSESNSDAKDGDDSSNSDDESSKGPAKSPNRQSPTKAAAKRGAVGTSSHPGGSASHGGSAPAEHSMQVSILEAHQRILDTSSIVETHKRINHLLEGLLFDQLGSRMSPFLLMQLCELRSLMQSLLLSTQQPIDYLTRVIVAQQQQQASQNAFVRRASAIGSISSSVVNMFYTNSSFSTAAGKRSSLGMGTRRDRVSVEITKAAQQQHQQQQHNDANVEDDKDKHEPGNHPTRLQRLSSLVLGANATEEVMDNSLAASFYRFIFGRSESEDETDFQVMMKKVAQDPTSLRNRMWMLLELHQSSREARMLHWTILFLILLSVLLLFTETLSTWCKFGESSEYCEIVVKAYCFDKHDPVLDPGCFVQNYANSSYLAYVNAVASDSKRAQRLSYFCEESHCYGIGNNFGSPNATMSCSMTGASDDSVDGITLDDTSGFWTYPFQRQHELLAKYGYPTLFTSRPAMHRQSAVCKRMECNPISESTLDGNTIWIKLEVFITIIFTIELGMRMAVADSVIRYFKDIMNTFDILAILPFYVEVYSSSKNMDFSIVSSSPQNYFFVISRSFKVFRMFKVVRHFDATKVLIETAQKTYEQLLGILGLLTFLVVVFAIMLYEVEKGSPCYQGDPGCPSVLGLKDGQRFLINKLGGVSQLPDVFYGLWFCFVTLTTTGYGDIVPVTNTGQVMTVFLMLAGSCYLSMPLAVAASTFYDVHRHYMKKRENPIGAGALAMANDMAMKRKKDLEWKRRLLLIKGSFVKYSDLLEQLITDLQSPVTVSNHPGPDHCPESALIKRVKNICLPMKKTLAACSEDIVQLVLTIASGNVDDQ